MDKENFLNTLGLSIKKIFLIWSGGLIFIIVFIAVILGVISSSWLVFLKVILLSLFLGLLWFYPWLKNNPLVKGFIALCLGLIILNVITGDRLLSAITNFSLSGKTHWASKLNKETNSNKILHLENGAALFSKSLIGSITFEKKTGRNFAVINTGKTCKYQGIVYSKILLPVKVDDKYQPEVFDSSSEEWWVMANSLILPTTTKSGSIISTEEQALLDNGWSITDVKNFSNTIVGIRFPAGTTGKELEFKNFVWIRAYARHSDGSFKKIFDDGNEHFTVIVGENNFVFLEVPKNKKIPDMVYWKTRG